MEYLSMFLGAELGGIASYYIYPFARRMGFKEYFKFAQYKIVIPVFVILSIIKYLGRF